MIRSTGTNGLIAFGSPPDRPRGDLHYNRYVKELSARIRHAQDYARENMQAATRRQRRSYHQEKKLFVVGAKVWLFTPVTKRHDSRKLTLFWSGPWNILEKVNDLSYRIIPAVEMESGKPETTVSIDRLKAYHTGTYIDEPAISKV